MQQFQPLKSPPAPPRRQRGITLFESLIAIVVAALGILGVVGVQMRTLADTQTSMRRAQAIRLIEDLDERLKATPSGLATLGSYVSGWSGITPVAAPAYNCRAVNCNPTQLAAFDLADWKATVQNSLPLGDANIFLAPGETADANRRLLGVMISWRENEVSAADTTYLTNIDATQVRADDNSLSKGAGTAITCPTGRICHLQYISGSSRCSPDHGGGTAIQYYC